MKEVGTRDQERKLGNGSRQKKLVTNAIKAARVAMATGLITTSTMPMWACGRSEDTLPEPTPSSATATPTPEDTQTLASETPTSTLVPTRTPTPEPTFAPTPEVMNEGTNFVFGEGVSLQQQQEIRDGMAIARGWLLRKAGIKIDNVSVFAFVNPVDLIDEYLKRTIFPQQREDAQRLLKDATAFAGENKDIFIITSSPGWVSASPIIGGPIKEGRIHTLFHEYFHNFQREVEGYNGDFPHWLNEGGGHFVAAIGLNENGIYPYEKIRQGHLREADKVKEPLKFMESAEGFRGAGSPYADEYSLGFLAVEFLLRSLPDDGIPDLAQFWEDIGKGTPWQIAFKSSFGKTHDQFYTEFKEWREGGFQEKLDLR